MGAKVTGIELARLRCEADDVVLSVMGVIFASDRM